jgi:hypothetical protein
MLALALRLYSRSMVLVSAYLQQELPLWSAPQLPWRLSAPDYSGLAVLVHPFPSQAQPAAQRLQARPSLWGWYHSLNRV